MKLKYLGTAAAEAYPAFFCDCEKCRKAKKLGGKNIRSRSQAMINNDLLIDFPADSFSHIKDNNIALNKIKNIIITHDHDDHCYLEEFRHLRAGFSSPNDSYHIDVYGSVDVEKLITPRLENTRSFIDFSKLQPYTPTRVGNYTVTALRAYHGGENPYFYIIESDNKAILYAHDTDVFYDEVWEYLKKINIKFNLVSLDCTDGNNQGVAYRGHMDLNRNIETRERLIKNGNADDKTIFVLNHFSHNGSDSVYDDFIKIAEEKDFTVSFDGMEIEI